MKRSTVKNVFLLVVRWGLGGMYLYSGLGSIQRPFEFLSAVHAYRLTGPILSVAVAGLLPWVEFVTGVCMIGDILLAGSLAASAGLAALFSVAIGSAWLRGLHISCGCFGSGHDVINLDTVLRSLSVLIVAAGGWWCCRTHESRLGTNSRGRLDPEADEAPRKGLSRFCESVVSNHRMSGQSSCAR